ncbi:sensor histidine kinase [Pseudonocardia sp. GCM10023141]|uniref:sensor histidine kinase n=1 Tax=Pseudonocardia sp. GCM10023141 TaxID=3252653 RepID=UPI0036071053
MDELTAEQPRTAPAVQRSVRDWIVDTLMFLCAAGLAVYMTNDRLSVEPLPTWMFAGEQVLGVLSCLSIWLRRRWPVQLCFVLTCLSAVSDMVGGAAVVTLFTVAVHRSLRSTAYLFVLGLVTSAIFAALRPDPTASFATVMAISVLLQGGLVGWGLAVHHRRQLVLSLQDRAARAETEAHLRAEQVQHQVREAIAREIHDVLGHRLSLLSVHAGALAYRPDAPPADIARAAEIIRESAHDALQDLREVVGVLRAPVGELLPQPTVGDIGALVAESVAAGMAVELHEDRGGAVPVTAGRTAYRIVQEGLTNARKHAPGADVGIRVEGKASEGLTVEVVNGVPTAEPVPAATSGHGLAGLTERVGLAGGRLEHGPTGAGGWRVRAWLPWPA